MKKRILSLLIGLLVLIPFTNVKAKSAAQYIIDLSKTDTVNIVTDDPDHNPRYIGTNPDNYVEFNGEEWRIVGVIDGKVKLIRTAYIDNTNPSIAWDSSARAVNSGCGVNYWSQADLMTELNTDYLNSDLADNVQWYSGSGNSKTAVFDHTMVIKSDAKEMIADATWYLGSPNYDGTTLYSLDQLSAELLYNNERLGTPAVLDPGTTSSNDGFIDRDATWTGKVALLYPSDFIYSTSGNTSTSRETCLTANGWNTNCANTSWLKDNYNIWTISASTMSGRNLYVFTFSQNLSNAGLVSWPSWTKVRPSLYLKENVVFYDGEGTKTNPYKLALANIVEFDSNGGSDVEVQYIEANDKVTEPTTPIKEDSTFLGWYTDAELTNEYDFNSDVNSNFKLYAKWQFNYKILSGADQTFEEDDITIKTNGDLSKLQSIKDNNEVIDSVNYILVSGSTILTLNADYLKTLANGVHTITFVYNDGSVSTSLTINNPEPPTTTPATTPTTSNTTSNDKAVLGANENTINPKTYDNIKLCIYMLGLGLMGFISTGLYIRKRTNNK